MIRFDNEKKSQGHNCEDGYGGHIDARQNASQRARARPKTDEISRYSGEEDGKEYDGTKSPHLARQPVVPVFWSNVKSGRKPTQAGAITRQTVPTRNRSCAGCAGMTERRNSARRFMEKGWSSRRIMPREYVLSQQFPTGVKSRVDFCVVRADGGA
jgi:hypothetical protein